MREVRAAFGLDHTKGDRAARIEIAKVLLRRDTKPDYDAWKAFREANPVKVKVHISRSEKLASLLAKRKQSLADQQAEHAKRKKEKAGRKRQRAKSADAARS